MIDIGLERRLALSGIKYGSVNQSTFVVYLDSGILGRDRTIALGNHFVLQTAGSSLHIFQFGIFCQEVFTILTVLTELFFQTFLVIESHLLFYDVACRVCSIRKVLVLEGGDEAFLVQFKINEGSVLTGNFLIEALGKVQENLLGNLCSHGICLHGRIFQFGSHILETTDEVIHVLGSINASINLKEGFQSFGLGSTHCKTEIFGTDSIRFGCFCLYFLGCFFRSLLLGSSCSMSREAQSKCQSKKNAYFHGVILFLDAD